MPKNEKDRERHERNKNKDERLDRHSGTGNQGLAKKGGHAGKSGWGKEGEIPSQQALDVLDPNYDSEEDELLSKVDPHSPVDEVVKNLFAYEDVEETKKSLNSLSADQYGRFIKKAVFLSMDKQAYEREFISKLLSNFYSSVLEGEDICEGFQQALYALPDIVLDIPSASEMLSKFLARALVDEIIPPIFLKEANAPTQKAKDCLQLAFALANENHGGERLQKIWGPGDLRSVKRLKQEVREFLEEFLLTQDYSEAEASLRKLNAPSFHFQVVKFTVRLCSVDKSEESNAKKLSALMSHFSKIALILPHHFIQGFNCCFESIDDLRLDAPNVETRMCSFLETAKTDGWIPLDYTPSLPSHS